MIVRIRLGQAFHEYTDNRDMVEVRGSTIRECLDNLIVLFPIFRVLLFGGDYSLGALITCGRDVIVASQLDRPVADGQEIMLFPMVYGG